MKREGRQHGMVRTYPVLPSPPLNSRTINVVDSTPTAGIFTKVNSSKPTNHSKFSGKCRKARCSDCHLRPSSKSSQKTKGSLKLSDVSEPKFLTWWVVDGWHGIGTSFADSSASEILGELDGEVDGGFERFYGDLHFDQIMGMDNCGYEVEIEEEEEEMKGEDGEEKMDGGDKDVDETMSFCEVGVEEGEDDSWCLVGEM